MNMKGGQEGHGWPEWQPDSSYIMHQRRANTPLFFRHVQKEVKAVPDKTCGVSDQNL